VLSSNERRRIAGKKQHDRRTQAASPMPQACSLARRTAAAGAAMAQQASSAVAKVRNVSETTQPPSVHV